MISVKKIDVNDNQQAELMVDLLNKKSSDPMGGNEPLSEYTKTNLQTELSKRNYCHVFIAHYDDVPAGLCICFEGFSTFACAPLMNVHDIAVLPDFRRKGVGASLLFYVEQFARSINCCKLTLEVLEGNHAAKGCYSQAGFQPYELDPDVGSAMFWQKKLS